MTSHLDQMANWKAADMADHRQWMIQLSDDQVDEFDRALQAAQDAGITIDRLTRAEFALPLFDALVPDVQERLENGRGVVVLRGMPAERYTKAQLRLLYWGLGLHLGTAVSQSSKGDLLGDVRNFGDDVNSSKGRGYMSRQGLGFHTDTADVVALLVMRAARSGGLSMICSSVAIREEIAATRPDLLDVLYQPFWWSWKGQEAAGETAYYAQPVYSERDGRFSSRHIATHILSAHEDFKDELPPLEPQQLEALKLVNALANDARFHFSMMFEPGDIQLLNNHVTYHARTEFDDFDEDERKRHLLRMWLAMPNSRALSPLMSAIYRDQAGGAVRGGFPSRTGTHSFATVRAQD